MKGNKIDDLKRLAKDLRQEQPRSQEEALGGFKGTARLVDKGRAALLGWEGEYQFGEPADRELAHSLGIELEDLKDILLTGASDDEVADWLRINVQGQPSH